MRNTVIIGGGQLAYYLLKIWPDATLAAQARPVWHTGHYVPMDISKASHVNFALSSLEPDLIINTAAMSSLAQSFEKVPETFCVNLMGPLYIMDWMKDNNSKAKFIQCSSIEVYQARPVDIEVKDLTGESFFEYDAVSYTFIRDEQCVKDSTNPYGKSKILSQDMVALYRSKYDLDASCAVFGNFESKMRGPQFVTAKVVNYVKQLKHFYTTHKPKGITPNDNGSVDMSIYINDTVRDLKYAKLELGNVNSVRSFMHASDAARAILCIAKGDKSGEWVFAGSNPLSIREFIERVFEIAGIPELNHMWISSAQLKRRWEPEWVQPSSKLAQEEFGWVPRYEIDDIIKDMLDG